MWCVKPGSSLAAPEFCRGTSIMSNLWCSFHELLTIPERTRPAGWEDSELCPDNAIRYLIDQCTNYYGTHDQEISPKSSWFMNKLSSYRKQRIPSAIPIIRSTPSVLNAGYVTLLLTVVKSRLDGQSDSGLFFSRALFPRGLFFPRGLHTT